MKQILHTPFKACPGIGVFLLLA